MVLKLIKEVYMSQVDCLVIQGRKVDRDRAARIAGDFNVNVVNDIPQDKWAKYFLMDKNGLSYVSGKQELKVDWTNLLSRVTGGHLQHEILLKAAKPETDNGKKPRAVDATAGLGEDSFILAAMGYEVEMFEHNPITAALLYDGLLRARNDSKLQDVARHMTFTKGESADLLRGLCYEPDVIYLDPMYPEKKKKAESKKKMQVLHQIEPPCQDEIDLMDAARGANPTKIVIKRPPEADYLAGITPTYSVERKAVRYDCLVLN